MTDIFTCRRGITNCQINMTSKLRFEHKALKSAPLSKGALLLVMLDRRFYIKILGSVSKKLWAVEHHCSLSFLYSTRNKETLNYTHTLLAIHWAISIKTFHFAIIPDWNLIYCHMFGNHPNFRKYWFHAKQSQVLPKQVLIKWMYFQIFFSLWELWQITDMLYVREIAEHFLIVTDVYIFMLHNL